MYALDFQSVPAVTLETAAHSDMTPGQFNKILRLKRGGSAREAAAVEGCGGDPARERSREKLATRVYYLRDGTRWAAVPPPTARLPPILSLSCDHLCGFIAFLCESWRKPPLPYLEPSKLPAGRLKDGGEGCARLLLGEVVLILTPISKVRIKVRSKS
ncbi:hypothetical protein GWI33_016409 [Rhynchophorus ferrugineus]|uniref:Uncharacterized protein n=1 Tax=Rhynchophorus ferrugineus TaxID=354439 RepID=A0A834IB63_RHYFE|nr:hypothetical protein GWI33_016409 [Rhynchophorus ferrugineus]